MKTYAIKSFLAIIAAALAYLAIYSFSDVPDSGALTAVVTIGILMSIVFFAAWRSKQMIR